MSVTQGFLQIPLGPGIRLFVHTVPTFKRTSAAVFLHNLLSPQDVAKVGILPRVQRRGNTLWPTALALERELASLYGAHLGTGVQKRGDRQISWFLLNLPGDRYVDTPILSRGLRLLREVILSPVIENGGLAREYVEQERQLQVGRIRSLINVKSSWAVFRCIEEMYRDEPFRLFEFGTEEQVRALTPEGLLRTHARQTREAPIDIYVVGDVDLDALKRVVGGFSLPTRTPRELPKTAVLSGREEVHTVIDEEVMGQGWLVLGFRTDIAYSDNERYAMHFLNGVLGGFVHSKLFLNVREKASLAYQASSGYNANKGYVLALAGIDPNKYDQALEIMIRQVDAIRQGDISDEEMNATRSRLVARALLTRDDPLAQMMTHLSGSMEGVEETADEFVGRLQRVTKKEIVDVAERVRLDTIYFLKGVAQQP
ncbi:MAG: EF-P 5-aminopentanol modification-associated protein YfmF [Limnochordia bacterium]|jgi:predicted Zn-dependent peptidase